MRPDFETLRTRYTDIHQRLATAVAGINPGLHWPSAQLRAENPLCDYDGTPARGFHGSSGMAAIGEGSYVKITPEKWAALDRAVRTVAAPYGFVGGPDAGGAGFRPRRGGAAHRGRGTSREVALSDFSRTIDILFEIRCAVPASQH